MSKTNFRSIHDQTDLSETLPLGLQPVLRNRLVPLPDIDCRVIQKTTQTSSGTHQLRRTRNLDRNLAQSNRMTLKDPNHQPHKVPYLRNPLVRSQFTNSLHPVM